MQMVIQPDKDPNKYCHWKNHLDNGELTLAHIIANC